MLQTSPNAPSWPVTAGVDFVPLETNLTESEKRDREYSYLIDVVRQIKIGDSHGMETLYDLLVNGNRFFLIRHMGFHDAEDTLHDCFLEVVRAICRGRVRDPKRLPGYIRTIVRRAIASHYESTHRLVGEQGDWIGVATPTEQRMSQEETTYEQQRMSIMRTTLRELGQRDQEILQRFYQLEQSPERIRVELGYTCTQFRLFKWKAKAHLEAATRKRIARRQRSSYGGLDGYSWR